MAPGISGSGGGSNARHPPRARRAAVLSLISLMLPPEASPLLHNLTLHARGGEV